MQQTTAPLTTAVDLQRDGVIAQYMVQPHAVQSDSFLSEIDLSVNGARYPSRMFRAACCRVLSICVVDVNIDLGFGVFIRRRVMLEDFDPRVIPRPQVSMAHRAVIAIVPAKSKLILQVSSRECRYECPGVVYLVEPPAPLAQLYRTLCLDGGCSICAVSLGDVLRYYQARRFPRDEIRQDFDRT